MAQVPVQWKLEQGVLLVTFIGDYPFGEFEAAVAEALRSPEFRPGTPILFDSRSSFKYPSTDALRSIAEWLASLRPQGLSARSATVTSRERLPLMEQVARRFREADLETAIFTDLAEALRWLGTAGTR
jgi:hypothetical protein